MRLVLEHGIVVEADAPGLDRDLTGLTPLEAAAVPGEMLAADALANALARVLRAEPAPGRVAVAMSGGVDSAVALLRAGPGAVGVTLRLWTDPAGRSSERVCCSPAAVVAARETCHALGLPHVTLDLRERFRARGRRSVRRRLCLGHDAQPVRPVQRRSGSPSSSRSRSASGPRCSGPATTRASSSAPDGAWWPAPTTRRRIRATCSRRCRRRCSSGSPSPWRARPRRRCARRGTGGGALRGRQG